VFGVLKAEGNRKYQLLLPAFNTTLKGIFGVIEARQLIREDFGLGP